MNLGDYDYNEAIAVLHNRLSDTVETQTDAFRWRVDALWWSYLILDECDPCHAGYARARAYIATELSNLGVIP